MGVVYEVRHYDVLRRYDIHTKIHEDWFRHSGNIKVITSTTWKAAVLVLLIIYAFEMTSDAMAYTSKYQVS
jgi:hypothetical protein